jgi:hypothetical protein
MFLRLFLFFLSVNIVLIKLVDCSENEINSEPNDQLQPLNLDDWVKNQVNKSWSILMSNVSPQGALPGLIVASLT